MDGPDLTDKVAVITGGSRGIRRAIADAGRRTLASDASAWITGALLRVDGGAARQLGL